MQNVPKSRQQNIVVQEVNGELLIYDLNLNKALCLNRPSALIWEACDGERSISEITKIVGEKLKTEINEDFTWLALDKLKKENLMVNPEEITQNFNGLTRREVIRRIGFFVNGRFADSDLDGCTERRLCPIGRHLRRTL